RAGPDFRRAAVGPRAARRLQLGPDTGALQHRLDQVEWGRVGRLPELAKLFAERLQPAKGLVEALDLVQVVERLGQGEGHVARVGVLAWQAFLEAPVVPAPPAGPTGQGAGAVSSRGRPSLRPRWCRLAQRASRTRCR